MARMTIDTRAREQARTALIAATAAYDDALRAVETARQHQHAAIVEARLEGVRQVDVTGLTQTRARPKGFTREHVRRIEQAYRKRLVWARNAGMDIDSMSIIDVLNIVLPGDEDGVEPETGPLSTDDLAAEDDDEILDDEASEDEDEDEDLPAGVVA